MKGLGKNDSPVTKKLDDSRRIYQYYLDKTVPYAVPRWAGTLVLALMFAIRVYLTKGYVLVIYFVGWYILCLLFNFLSPLVAPEFEPSDGAVLPTKSSDEFKPFIRRLPEFKFWHSAIIKAFLIAFVMTFFWIFDLPVFWPILLVAWVGLFALIMKYHIARMVKYKYIPFSFGKPKYGRKKLSTAN